MIKRLAQDKNEIIATDFFLQIHFYEVQYCVGFRSAYMIFCINLYIYYFNLYLYHVLSSAFFHSDCEADISLRADICSEKYVASIQLDTEVYLLAESGKLESIQLYLLHSP